MGWREMAARQPCGSGCARQSPHGASLVVVQKSSRFLSGGEVPQIGDQSHVMKCYRFLLPLLFLAASAFATDVPEGFTSLIASHDLAGWLDSATAGEHWKIDN